MTSSNSNNKNNNDRSKNVHSPRNPADFRPDIVHQVRSFYRIFFLIKIYLKNNFFKREIFKYF